MGYEMKNNYFLKILVSLLLTIFVSIGLFPGVGICKDKLSKKKYNLKDYQRRIGTYTYAGYLLSDGGMAEEGELIVRVSESSNPEGLLYLMDWDRDFGGGKTSELDIMYQITKSGWIELGRSQISHWNGQVWDSVNEAPILVLPFSNVSVGENWGGAFIEERTMSGGGTFYFPRIWTFTILGTETVTVNEGTEDEETYADCLKIARYRASMGDSVKWYAKGIGQVKMIYPNATGGGGQLFELLTYTSTP